MGEEVSNEQIPSEEEWAEFKRFVLRYQHVQTGLHVFMLGLMFAAGVRMFPVTEPVVRGFFAGAGMMAGTFFLVYLIHPRDGKMDPVRWCDERFAQWRARQKERDND